MRSSISSSEARLRLLGALCAALAFFAAYEAYLRIARPVVDVYQTASDANAAALQNYLYASPAPSTVIVGSSLAARLPVSAFRAHAANLALSAEGAMTGLAFLRRAPHVPGTIYVEINEVVRPANGSLLESVYANPGFALRRAFLALRTEYEPVNVLFSALRSLSHRKEQAPDRATHDLNANIHREEMKSPYDGAKLAVEVDALKRDVDYFARRRVRVVLFEMPIDADLENLPQTVQVRNAVMKALPTTSYCWATLRLSSPVATEDGAHLDPQSAADVAHALAGAKNLCD